MGIPTGSFPGFDLSLREPGIAWFEFNTPERLNGMTASLKRDLIECVTQAQMDDAVRVLVFTGRGKAFCAGNDLKYQSSGQDNTWPPTGSLTAP
jgi:2-(1,2-epoxy-1,2-dihydrophenyl)acetyl-CoA isomerase